MRIHRFEGVIPPMVTPLTKDGDVDLEGLVEVTRFLIDGGVHGLFPLGTIGEGPKFSREERRKIIETVVGEADKKGIPVIPGAGGITTRDTITYTKDAKDAGAAGVVIHPPWYFHPTPEALLKHYRRIADEVDLPIILYNIPSFAGYEIPAEVVVKASQSKNIAGIKDSSANMLYYQQLIASCPKEFNVIQGYGSLFLPSLSLGGKATMAGEANVAPKIMVGIYENFIKGDLEEARRLHYKIVSLLPVFGYGTFPVGVKVAMNMMGLRAGYVREPSAELDDQKVEKIRQVLKDVGLI
ncbi:MAG: 4-hydroxy-tetrahydrodipicolinate synthase [Candidatus Bathyarchaeia archaeon]|nr:4-hydroxy-tetrahydrodipicolinate synthase [Candidatus Bathyarchaeota archaeon]